MVASELRNSCAIPADISPSAAIETETTLPGGSAHGQTAAPVEHQDGTRHPADQLVAGGRHRRGRVPCTLQARQLLLLRAQFVEHALERLHQIIGLAAARV